MQYLKIYQLDVLNWMLSYILLQQEYTQSRRAWPNNSQTGKDASAYGKLISKAEREGGVPEVTSLLEGSTCDS